MKIDPNHLPTDTNALHELVRQQLGTVQAQGLKIAELEARIAKLKRSQFGLLAQNENVPFVQSENVPFWI